MRCLHCGGVIREVRNGKKCDCCGSAEINGAGSPDPWVLVQVPEEFDSEAAHRRRGIRRRT